MDRVKSTFFFLQPEYECLFCFWFFLLIVQNETELDIADHAWREKEVQLLWNEVKIIDSEQH